MLHRIAKVDQQYAQRMVKVGEGFLVEPRDVPLLIAIGRIDPQADDPVPGFMPRSAQEQPAQGYATRIMTAILPAQSGPAVRGRKAKAPQ